VEALSATRASSDEELVASWLASLKSAHSRRNFAMTAQRFLAALPMGLRRATVEEVRDAITAATVGASAATARQYTLRIKSLLSYEQDLGVHALQCRRADQGPERRRQPRREPDAAGLAMEAELTTPLGLSDDAIEGKAAFVEKRTPVFR
jgi:hypothetical protein